jgi:hypothetical protein
MSSAWRNQTGIEDWIMEKAAYRRRDQEKQFENPYKLVRSMGHSLYWMSGHSMDNCCVSGWSEEPFTSHFLELRPAGRRHQMETEGGHWRIRHDGTTIRVNYKFRGPLFKSYIFLTQVEQILQKHDKRERTREYKIVLPYSGSWFPLLSQGLRVTCRPPCTDEPRIPLLEGDVVRVTRWKK